MSKWFAMAALTLAACGSTVGERAVTGGAIGAGTGAVIGSVTPFGTIPGRIVGGVAGAALRAVTTPLP